MASCLDWGVALYLYIVVANSSEEVVRLSVFFGCRDGEEGRMASDCKKVGEMGEKIELQYVFQRH